MNYKFKRFVVKFLIWLRNNLTTSIIIDKVIYTGRRTCTIYFRVEGTRYFFSDLGDFREEWAEYGSENVVEELSQSQYKSMANFLIANHHRWARV